MATVYTQEIVDSIAPDVVDIFKSLMEASTGVDSVYLKAKETLIQILNDANITGDQKGEIVAQTISNMVNGITAQSMDSAMKIAVEDRLAPYTLTKMREETKAITASVSKMESDIKNTDAEILLKRFQGWKIQGEVKRDFGIDAHDLAETTVIVPSIEYHNEGIKYETIRQAQANTYGAYAGSFRTHGYVDVTTDVDGMLGVSTTGSTAIGKEGLTYWQTRVAERQEQGFDDNMRQHVVNSSATMISMLLSTEASGIDYTSYLSKWTLAANYLNSSDGSVQNTKGGGTDGITL